MITVSKEVLLNLGNFSNIKIIASITASDDNFEIAWKELNQQIAEQEALERAMRIAPAQPTPNKEPPKGFVKVPNDLPF